MSRFRCTRIIEIQKADAIRLNGAAAAWKDVGQRCWTILAGDAPAAMRRRKLA